MTHTPGPWVQFSHQGKIVAIMPAGRDGDICTFASFPTPADANLMTAAPDLLEALKECAEQLALLAKEPKSNPWVQQAYDAIAKATK